jgi:hypothetical protein
VHAIHMDKKRKGLKKENKICLRKENVLNKEDKLGSKEKEPKTEELKINGKNGKRKNKENVLVDTTPLPVKIKSEYTEMKTEDIYLESYVKPEIKDNKLTSISTLCIVKNGNNKDSIKVDDNLDYKSKIKSDILQRGHKRECSKKHKTKRKSGFSSKRFSPEEDQIILDAIEEFGDEIDIAQIAEDLQRTVSSIGQEVRKLKAGKEKKKLVKKYTLSEDLVILDAVLENLGEDSLKLVNLTQSAWREIGAQIGKEAESLRTRWDVKIRPWILQHFAGTLNLDLKRPLANYLAENFPDVNSIDWSSVARKPAFAGHTQISLRSYFSSFLFRSVLHKDCEDISLERIAKFANTKYAEGGRKVLDKDLKRQQEIIAYFECFVKTKGIENFL